MNYNDDLQIDKYSLDVEWLRQPTLFMIYAEKSALAESVEKRAKENLKLVEAELSVSIRKQKAEDGEKVTEALIDAEIKSHKEYKKASDLYFTAMEESKILSLAVEAFNQRKAALENLVKLYLSGYFSQPKEERVEGVSIVDKAVDYASEKQRKKINIKKKEGSNL